MAYKTLTNIKFETAVLESDAELPHVEPFPVPPESKKRHNSREKNSTKMLDETSSFLPQDVSPLAHIGLHRLDLGREVVRHR